ncbi:hypothetical protein KUV62_04090 [Salipiger bermudensis]|uniref:hypothetical protein n=1 Tax=Salipiger bermudensis TaxID=344736 RepID=UPI001C996671|nr:hypothetical protein [Salipiger bermudensis]MBY6003073.1 hypothetical protein [Salipiger bermudensis]
MHDSKPIPRSEAYETAWELIPWYVNGSLPEDEAELVRHQARISPEFAAEVARQHDLAQQVATVDPSDAPVDRSWEKLRAQIDAEATARAPVPRSRGWLAGLRGGYTLGGLGVAACVLLAVVLFQPEGDDYQTLTSGSEAGPAIKFQLAGDLSPDALAQLLAAHGLTLIDGPSEAGVYTAAASAEADLATAARDLMATPEVLFAAPDE